MGFIIVVGLILGVGALIYFYAKHVGQGNVRAAFDDPGHRRKIIILGAIISAFAAILLLVLVVTETISF